MRWFILLVLFSFPALAAPLDWEVTDCSELPISYPGNGFVCKKGNEIPATAHVMFHMTRKNDTYLRIYVGKAKGTWRFENKGKSQIWSDFQSVDSWVYNNARRWEMMPFEGGTLANVIAGKQSCFYHHSFRGRKQGGYRYLRTITYCEEGNDYLPSDKTRQIIRTVKWKSP